MTEKGNLSKNCGILKTKKRGGGEAYMGFSNFHVFYFCIGLQEFSWLRCICIMRAYEHCVWICLAYFNSVVLLLQTCFYSLIGPDDETLLTLSRDMGNDVSFRLPNFFCFFQKIFLMLDKSCILYILFTDTLLMLLLSLFFFMVTDKF